MQRLNHDRYLYATLHASIKRLSAPQPWVVLEQMFFSNNLQLSLQQSKEVVGKSPDWFCMQSLTSHD